jgi:uncharacterized membrane protein YkoI
MRPVLLAVFALLTLFGPVFAQAGAEYGAIVGGIAGMNTVAAVGAITGSASGGAIEVAVPAEGEQAVEVGFAEEIKPALVNCVVSSEFSRGISYYVRMLSETKDKGEQAKIMEKISQLKQKALSEKAECTTSAVSPVAIGVTPVQKPVAKPLPSTAPTAEPVACTTEYSPVCGADGRTYSNKCFASVAGIEVAYSGKCEEEKPPEIPGDDYSDVQPTGGVYGYYAAWYGKVNQVSKDGKSWMSDPDGVTGADAHPLAYCQKWFPDAKGVDDIGRHFVPGFKNRGNLGSFDAETVVYECTESEGVNIVTPLVVWGNGFPTWRSLDGQTNPCDLEKQMKVQGKPWYGPSCEEAGAGSAGPSWVAVAEPVEVVAKPALPSKAYEVSQYYREKMTDIVESEDDAQAQVAELKTLQKEIDAMIEKLLSRQGSIDAGDMGQVVDAIEVTPGSVKADNVEVLGPKVISATLGDAKPVEVETSANAVTVTDAGVSAGASAVTLTRDSVKIGGRSLKVTPSEAAKKVIATVTKMRIEKQDERPVYKIDAEKKVRVLGIFPTKMEQKVTVDGESGQVVSTEKPWWGDLATDDG